MGKKHILYINRKPSVHGYEYKLKHCIINMMKQRTLKIFQENSKRIKVKVKHFNAHADVFFVFVSVA